MNHQPDQWWELDKKNQPETWWERGNVIELYAPNHIVRCTACTGQITENTMFVMKNGKPEHDHCPRRRHLRAVP